MSEKVPHLRKVTPHSVSGVSGAQVGFSTSSENRNFSLSLYHQFNPTSPHLESLQASKKLFCVAKWGTQFFNPISLHFTPTYY